jgi:DNA-binding transcriptional regulator YdaS (Cro superfamily)
MDMRSFLNSIDQAERERIAIACETTVDYFWQIAGNHRKPGALLARKIDLHTEGKVTAAELRPDIFGNIEHAA